MDEDARNAAIEAGWRAGLGYALSRPAQTPAGMLGEQLGSGVGNSIEFMDYREYTPGDDLRRIDWSAYARSDRLVIKLNREEVTPHLDLILDTSRSMALEGSAKAQATLGLAAALSASSDNARMTRRVYTATQRLEPVPGGEGDPHAWHGPTFAETGEDLSLGAAMHEVAVPMRRRGVRVLVSDLLCPDDPWPIVSRLAEGASSAHIVQLLARQDVDPSWNGDLRLIDSESGELRELRLDATALSRYRQQLDRLRDQWRSACARAGVRMTELIAEDLVADWDMGALVRADVLRLV
ncbi:DUF58 domain-containing protein [Algisphaera agarilytica]|uniref:Uncharacterized protein (DUF58 family) n=1 Tax=Algisphaera agarilytica TaxID=1385975 RepID=A0A7X0LJ19_9BACT|nr:DUF58 domain-containing protein [Algisphaera agarilytica]MBB6428835.1 uncharacterized protein (DUF58 family) [Algisphaera agarilytica]